jgi:putative hydrolase of the HAD superfamily
MFHEACRLAGVAPLETLHIGDDPALDVIGARAAGLQMLRDEPMPAHNRCVSWRHGALR